MMKLLADFEARVNMPVDSELLLFVVLLASLSVLISKQKYCS